MISVVLADDHVVVRTGIKMLLDADSDIEVVAEAAEGTEAYSLVARYKPDVLLLDISMPPGQSGLSRARKRQRISQIPKWLSSPCSQNRNTCCTRYGAGRQDTC